MEIIIIGGGIIGCFPANYLYLRKNIVKKVTVVEAYSIARTNEIWFNEDSLIKEAIVGDSIILSALASKLNKLYKTVQIYPVLNQQTHNCELVTGGCESQHLSGIAAIKTLNKHHK